MTRRTANSTTTAQKTPQSPSTREKALVIVESPTKARTIRRFLPAHFVVEASVGHVRDLPQSAADIPSAVKSQPWARLGIDVDNDFAPLYITPKGKSKLVGDLRRKVKEADILYLATDEDREGESISWHLVETLRPKVPVKRMVFHEITKSAIQEALANCRDIDMDLVRAQEARRVLDRLYGYTLSPLIWKKIAYGLSAGRVQSPGLRLIVERERERIVFRKSVYWDLKALLRKQQSATDAAADAAQQRPFEARLVAVAGARVATGKDFDATTGAVTAGRDVLVLDEAAAAALRADIADQPWVVESVVEKDVTTRPAVPFITSTLQQEANRKLNMTARETMRAAQRLYEEGLITYMRTDSPTLSAEGIAGARNAVVALFGDGFLSAEPRQFSARAKSAQEAHEAIRPSGEQFVHPDQSGLSGSERALYDMIWRRTLASQMADAKKSSVTAKIAVGRAQFQANGMRIVFPGFLRVYVEGHDDPESALDDKELFLPPLATRERLHPDNVESLFHETKPPARYTEASLVQRLEREGIGRPSTYASIISTLFERGYVRKHAGALVPTFTGIAVVQFLETNFPYLIDYGFTSTMESSLDEIATGTRDRSAYLADFYNGDDGLVHRVTEREGTIKPEQSRTIHLPQLKDATEIKIGRFGPYIVFRPDGSTEEVHASIPEEIPPADLSEHDIAALIELQKNGPLPLGNDPAGGKPVYCLTGRFGPYVQLGQADEAEPKPRRASVPKNVAIKDVTIEDALRWLSLPRNLGVHPETGAEIVANDGRFGPYVVHNGEFRSLKKDDDVYTITLDRALQLLAEPKKGRGGAAVLRDLGVDAAGKKVVVYDGKYGPYIKYGSKNLSLPEDLREPQHIAELTLESVATLLNAKQTRKR